MALIACYAPPLFKEKSELVVVVVVPHIQRIGCQPEKNYQVLYTVASPARGLLNRGKKKKSLPAPPPPCSFGENKNKNHATHPHV